MKLPQHHRLLIIDDNPEIHEDFRKVLDPAGAEIAQQLTADEAVIFGTTPASTHHVVFQIDSAFQGREGLEKVRAAAQAGLPYAVAFVDVRMPPGWDGVETITHIWREFPDLQIVLCTAYSDYSWEEIAKVVAHTDQVLVLKKPFDNIEVLQMAHALSKKWELTQIAHRQHAELDALVSQRTVELSTANAQLTHEVAEHVRLDAELRQAQKMEAVGRLAAGVAHDFNNILTVILGNASLHLHSPQLEARVRHSLDQITKAAERASGLTQQLLAYSRKQNIQRRPLSLNATIEQTVAMLRRVIGEPIAIVLQLAPDLPPVFADPSNLDQVIMNLALNARDAMTSGGPLTFTTSHFELGEATAALHPELHARRFICLAVKDTGHGIDAATIGQIFEPFFTTKEPGKGTGMGLATVYGIVRQHDGWIEVDAQPGRDTTFRVFLPLSVENLAEPAAVIPGTLPFSKPPPRSTILVVEDEDLLREFVNKALERLGYRTRTAADGHKALQIWAEHRDEIAVLFTDVVMPESLSGHQLAQKLLLDRPDLKVIFTSGYSAERVCGDSEQHKKHDFLAKPYRIEQLADIMARQFQTAPA